MTEAVLDASVVIKWFRSDSEPFAAEAKQLRAAGDIAIPVPRFVSEALGTG